MVKTGPTNSKLLVLVSFLEKTARRNKAPIWKRTAELLLKPRRKMVEVNLGKISRQKGTVLVPGKVLASGSAGNLTVAAFSFSGKAREKIAKAGGKVISIQQLVENNPSGKNVSLLI